MDSAEGPIFVLLTIGIMIVVGILLTIHAWISSQTQIVFYLTPSQTSALKELIAVKANGNAARALHMAAEQYLFCLEAEADGVRFFLKRSNQESKAIELSCHGSNIFSLTRLEEQKTIRSVFFFDQEVVEILEKAADVSGSRGIDIVVRNALRTHLACLKELSQGGVYYCQVPGHDTPKVWEPFPPL